MDTIELLERCRTGDQLAWEVLVRRYQSQICSITYGYVGNADEARDLAQETFVKLYRKLDHCPGPDLFKPWMIKIARNTCLDHLRRIKARPPRQDIAVEEMYDLRDPGPTPDDQWEMSSRKRLVYRAMRSLSKISCEIILLKDIQGLSLEEISRVLAIPIGTAKSRSNRARLELARAVQTLNGPSASEASG